MDFDELLNYLDKVNIAHHIRGRVRLRLTSYPKELSSPESYLSSFQSILDKTPGIKSVRMNLLARSCLVEYDPNLIPDQAWKDFIAHINSSDAQILEQTMRNIYQEITHAKL